MQQGNWWDQDETIQPAPPRAQQPSPQPAPGQLQQILPPQPKEATPQTPEQRLNTITSTQHTQAEMGSIPLQQQQTRVQTHNAQVDAESGLRQEFAKRPEVQMFQTILPQYTSAIRAADNRAGDLSLIIAYNKVLDPNSVVREGEVQNASQVGSMTEQAQGYLRSLTGQGRLTPDQRAQILGELRTRASQAADAYNLTRSAFEKNAAAYGFDPTRVVGPHPALPFQQVEADYLGRPVRNLDGSFGPPPLKGWSLEAQKAGLPPGDGGGDTGNHVTHYGEGTGNWAKVPAPPGGWDSVNAQYATVGPPGDPRFGQIEVPDGYSFGGWTSYQDPQTKRPFFIPRWNKLPPPDISDARTGKGWFEPIDAAIRGAADVPSFGFSDEIAAGLNSITHPSTTYRDNLRRERAIDAYDMQNHALPRFGGEIGGGFLLPMGRMATLPQIAGKSAAVGALYGFGSTDGSLGDRAVGAAESGAAGGLLGATIARGIPLAKKGVRGLLGIAANEHALPPLVDPATGSLNQPLQDATPAQRVAAAQQFGIDLPLDAATDKGGAIIGKGLDISPVSAGVMNDARRATEAQMKQAAVDVAGRYGDANSLYAGGQAAQQGAKNWIDRFETVASKAYDAIPIRPETPTTLANTKAALTQMTSAYQSNPQMAQIFQNPRLTRIQDALNKGGLSWQDLKALRSTIGDEIGAERFSDSPTRTQLRGLYGALSQDMHDTAASQGPGALNAFDRANAFYAAGQQRIEGALSAILGDASNATPEAAAARIQTIAKSGKGSANIAQLEQIRNSMAKGPEWNEVASSMISLMGQPANSAGRDFNPQVFVRNYADMSEPARNLLFGDRGRAELRQALDQFVAVNQRLAGTDALRNTTQTASNRMGAGTVAAAAATGAGLVLQPVATLLTLGSTGMAAGANYGMARLWTSPAFVRWATGYTALEAEKASPQALQSQIGRLKQVAATNPELRDSVAWIQQQLLQGLGAANSDQGQR